jgi:hypothetical protein
MHPYVRLHPTKSETSQSNIKQGGTEESLRHSRTRHLYLCWLFGIEEFTTYGIAAFWNIRYKPGTLKYKVYEFNHADA